MAASGSGTNTIRPIVPHGTNETTLEIAGNLEIAENVGPLSSLKAFCIRNGDLSAAKSLLIRPAVPPMYHWSPISGLAHTAAIANVGAFIRVAHAQMTIGSPAGTAAGLMRKRAIILGTVRAVVTELYAISDSDLIPGERAGSMLVATQGDNGAWTFGFPVGLQENIKTELRKEFSATEDERAAISAIHMCSIGLPACQGFSLIMTGHHFLDDPKGHSRRCFNVVENAFWKHSAVRSWFEDNTDDIRDAMWHKSCHPLAISLKQKVSQSLEVKAMIIEAGAGAAASRLPAVESELRRAKSYKTLLQTVRTMYEESGGTTNFLTLDEAIAVTELMPRDMVFEEPHGYDSVPISVNSRARALKHLANVCDRCDDVVAHAWGFFVGMDDRAQMMSATQGTSTLRTANSLSKLDTVSPAAFRAGMAFYEDYMAMKAAKRARGEFSIANLITGLVNDKGMEEVAVPEAGGGQG